ncbi:MAG: phosphonate ABC transporter substrate-binding protein [Meiothermus sp.]|uniref:phosphonate ABC transporter substrate-binding protein n=1 Tax=Meiothermus sp. TaxID=1955249 RepID=UPI0025EB1CC2|nr:phosphonate ABC transporter substrate-binding protein [Meiothermus sp.]MCS7068544.1 phosphonate ABC transporter substrate-binding protein [Meiothermus sp.]MCX7739440.1 phosphonate ABC transporter substrate-binding protein [Meiothermus sp.]MDW8425899.1 phosphonate ABC transporter substrate-binding protein [Meiothermus sp.]
MKIPALIASLALGLGLAQGVDRTGWPREITFATVPTETNRDATNRFKPLIEHLERRLGIKVNFRNGADYAAVTIAMQNKQVDIGYYGPGSYLDAEDQAGAEAIVKEDSVTGGVGYYSLIISKKGGPIRSLADARGKAFAFVDPGSTSGFRVPMHAFCTKLNIEPSQYFGRVFFAGTHENVILGVANGTIEVGATFDLGIISATEKGAIKGLEQEFNVLYKSDLIPASPIAVRKDLPATLKSEIQKALLAFDNKEFLESTGLKRYVPASPADYVQFRQINRFRQSTCPR